MKACLRGQEVCCTLFSGGALEKVLAFGLLGSCKKGAGQKLLVKLNRPGTQALFC